LISDPGYHKYDKTGCVSVRYTLMPKKQLSTEHIIAQYDSSTTVGEINTCFTLIIKKLLMREAAEQHVNIKPAFMSTKH